MRYVVGFVRDQNSVLLVRKIKPDWQAGMLNGIGGKIEPGESAADAMVREFDEEVGAIIQPENWRLFAILTGGDYEVHFFAHQSDHGLVGSVHGRRNDVGERFERVTLDTIRRTFRYDRKSEMADSDGV